MLLNWMSRLLRPGRSRSRSSVGPISVDPKVVKKDVAVSDPVWILLRGELVKGHAARKTRKHCSVVVGDGTAYKIPWRSVFARPGGERKRVASKIEEAKSKFRAGDQVVFDHKHVAHSGRIIRMNPKTALVSTSDIGEWMVSYELLSRVSTEGDEDQSLALEAVVAKADRLMSKHRLNGWSFQFDDALKRGGQCDHAIRVISMAREFCRVASEAEWTDTLLHEIAHALVGPGHHHDAVWKRKARQIGCSSDRCHSVRFTRPKYVLTCPRCKWAVTRMRRTRGLICRRCSADLRYHPYTDEFWEAAQARKRASLA